MTIAELGEVVNRLTGNSAALQLIPDARAPADPQKRKPDIRRAKEVLDWEPVTPLERGLQNTLADFRKRL
jgi:dTDP-glucose 4,6-dehydratase